MNETLTTLPLMGGMETWGVQELGPLETLLMEMLWDAVTPQTTGDLHRQMADDARDGTVQYRGYTTLKTTLTRLTEKGLLVAEMDHRNQAMLYTPTLSRQETTARLVQRLVQRALTTDPAAVQQAMRSYSAA